MRLVTLTVLTAALLTPATAHAVEIGVQDDQAIVYGWHDRDGMLSQFKAMGGTHVRINVIRDSSGLTHATLEQYDAGIAAIRAHGLTPQLTLIWGYEDDDRVAAWMGEMAAHFAPMVDRYSVLNEPDIWIPAADDCDSQSVARMVRSGAISSVMRKRSRRVRYRGHRTHVRRRHGRVRHYGRVRGHRVRVWRTKGHRRQWHRRVVRKRVVRLDRRRQQTVTGQEVRGGCVLVVRGRKYGRIARAAIPAIRHADPGAQVFAGETSPLGDIGQFIRAAGDTGADAWAHHPYRWNPEFADVATVRHASGLPVYATEFAVRPGEGSTLAEGWRTHVDQGALQVLQYQWYTPFGSSSWDTSLESVGGNWFVDAIGAVA